jgi:hypothetical protein
MRSMLENEFSMMTQVHTFSLKRKSETASITGFDKLITNLGEGITNVDGIATKLKSQESGDSEIARSLLIDTAAETSSKAVWYASSTDNADLLKHVSFTKKGLRRMTGVMLLISCESLYDKVKEELEEMKTYGLDAKSQEELLAAINGYRTAKPGLKLSSTEVKQLNKDLRTGFSNLQGILYKMDKGVGPLEFSNKDYFDSYHNLRKVVDTGKRSLALKIQVNGNGTGEGLSRAKVSIVPADVSGNVLKTSGVALIVKKTAKKGGVNIRSMAEGKYQMTVTKVGHKDKIISFIIEDGKMTKVVVEMDMEG